MRGQRASAEQTLPVLRAPTRNIRTSSSDFAIRPLAKIRLLHAAYEIPIHRAKGKHMARKVLASDETEARFSKPSKPRAPRCFAQSILVSSVQKSPIS